MLGKTQIVVAMQDNALHDKVKKIVEMVAVNDGWSDKKSLKNIKLNDIRTIVCQSACVCEQNSTCTRQYSSVISTVRFACATGHRVIAERSQETKSSR